MAPLVRAAQFINTCRQTGVLNLTNFINYANSSKSAAYANFSILKNQSKIMCPFICSYAYLFELKLIFLFRNKNYEEW